MTITTRPYHDERDLGRIIELVTLATATDLDRAYFHVGDLLWGTYQNTIFDPRASVQLWEDDDDLVGVAWGGPAPKFYWLQTHPRTWNERALEIEMLAWAEQRLRAASLPEGQQRTLSISALARDQRWIELLRAHGYERSDEGSMLVMRQPLPSAAPAAALPAGWIVRPVGDEHEWPARVELHREVWHPSKVTLDAYRRLRAAQGYLSDLDLVAVAPDGTLAAYCICWLDPHNRIGEFEPVGTRAAFRGQGIGRALIQAGLHQLHQHGAQRAVVYTFASNAAAAALYRSTGFTVTDTNDVYGKTL